MENIFAACADDERAVRAIRELEVERCASRRTARENALNIAAKKAQQTDQSRTRGENSRALSAPSFHAPRTEARKRLIAARRERFARRLARREKPLVMRNPQT